MLNKEILFSVTMLLAWTSPKSNEATNEIAVLNLKQNGVPTACSSTACEWGVDITNGPEPVFSKHLK